LTVTIRPDGSVESVELDRSSGLKVLDAAAFKIVQMASPFAAFPADIRRDTDLLVITRTWFFGQGDKMWTQARN
jgi:protein TonB